MTPVNYPWPWLADALAPPFAVRYPWAEAARRAGGAAESACLLVPEVAGPLAPWGAWLENELAASRPVPAEGRDFAAAASALELLAAVEPAAVGDADDWAAAFLVAARRRTAHVEPVPLLVVDPDAGCVAGLAALARAQRAIGYPVARPVVVARAAPAGWAGPAVRFGLPEPAGDLHRVAPPTGDTEFWSEALLALTAVWEAGAAPELADELWQQLRRTRTLPLTDPRFDGWLDRRLESFAREVPWPADATPPADLAFGPARPDALDDALWQAGAVGHADGWLDVTPLRARTWVATLADPAARDAVRRRRLVNAPLARWLAAWASTVEESLRVLTLRIGLGPFRDYLLHAQPRDPQRWASRWEELRLMPDANAVGVAEFGDLARFVAGPLGRGGDPAAQVLDRCRVARNLVVHERTATAKALFDIAAAVEWLASRGAV